MENETVSKNFIEQIIDKDLAEGHCKDSTYPVPAGAQWISAYRTCKIHSVKLRTGTGVWRKIQHAF